MIGLPDIDASTFKLVAACVEDAADDAKREAGFAGDANVFLVGRSLFVEGSEHFGGSGLVGCLFSALPHGEQLGLCDRRGGDEQSFIDNALEHLAAAER